VKAQVVRFQRHLKESKQMYPAHPNASARTRSAIAYDDAPAACVRDAPPIDLWHAWLLAEADATLMLYDWLEAATEDKAWTHAGYRAALDREEHAARVLADRLTRE
jgi:hypothetical protein